MQQCTSGEKPGGGPGDCGNEATHVLLVDRSALVLLPYARRLCRPCAAELATIEERLGRAESMIIVEAAEIAALERRG